MDSETVMLALLEIFAQTEDDPEAREEAIQALLDES